MNASFPSVLLLTDSDVFAGTERHMLDLAKGLRDLGCPVAIAGPQNGVLAKRAAEMGLDVFPVEKQGKADLPAVKRLIGGLRAKRFDLIHTHNGRTAFLAAMSTLLAGRGKLVATQHFLEPAHTTLSGAKAWISRRLHRWIAGRASRIVAISEAVSETIKARGGIDPQKVCVVLNGISDPAAAGHNFSRQAVRDSLGIPDSTPLIVTTARLVPEKGLDVLVRAMRQVAAELPQVRCVIAGEGKLREELQALIDKEGIGQSVTLLGFRNDALALVAAGDIFVLPSPSEPFGLSLVEAMALSKPVIATRAGGPRDIVEHGVSGLLILPSDATQLAAAVKDLLTSPDKMTALGAKARERFLERFQARRMAEKMASLYQAAMQTP